MRTAQIDGTSTVVNVIDAPEGFTLPGFALVASATAQRGDAYSNGLFISVSTPAPVPASVTRAQARAALFKAGLLDTIDAYVGGLTGDDGRLTQIWWADALNFERASPTIAAIGTVLGLTSDQIDGLFRTADGLSA